jgi:hypothetical protein
LWVALLLGGGVAAYARKLQTRVSDIEKDLTVYKLYVAEHYASLEFLTDLKREITDPMRDVVPTH